MRKRKKLSHQTLLGQQGANLIERIVGEMGQVWRPTQVHDTGVDGTIEFRDAATGRVFNRFIQVQSKATSTRWESETDKEFVYRVRSEDLDYWLRGNLPVILVVSRPSTGEAYWISIKSYFSDPVIRKSKKVVFSKNRNAFEPAALPLLQHLAIPAAGGVYKPPLRKQEELISNLLPIRSFSHTLYLADTSFRNPAELVGWFAHHDIRGNREWILRNERILTFHDLREPPWTEVSDRGTFEQFSSCEWSESDDPDRLREWVELLNHTLAAKLWREGIRRRREHQRHIYYFLCAWHSERRFYSYKSHSQKTRREVVRPFRNSRTNEFTCFRHSAIEARFLRFDQQWYLEINPTYYFTKDGTELYEYHSDQLAGIKRLEHNQAVCGQLIMWERLLTDRGDLFRTEYPLLSFDELRRFQVPCGIPDELWLPLEDQSGVSFDGDDSEEMLF